MKGIKQALQGSQCCATCGLFLLLCRCKCFKWLSIYLSPKFLLRILHENASFSTYFIYELKKNEKDIYLLSLLVQATFEDNLEDEAIAKNHSTTKEAIKVGTSAGAYRVILTHFSQRYPKFPVFDERHMRNTCIAFDLMSVNVADLPVLPKVLPYLKVLFRNEMILDEQDDAVELASQQ